MAVALFFASLASLSAATITVNSTADAVANDGACTLREAINSANSNAPSGPVPGECIAGEVLPTVDTIVFDISGGCPTVCTIAPTNPYLVSEAVFINGYTQPGAMPNGVASGSNAVLKIEIDGTSVPNVTGAVIDISSGSTTIRGLIVNRGGAGNSGIRMDTAGGNTIQGNFIGTDHTGTIDLGNSGHGILVESGSINQIGGTLPELRNVISGNQLSGISISNPSDGNLIRGNYIGTTASGNSPLGNSQNGITLVDSAFNQIGDGVIFGGNLICANGLSGIFVSGSLATVNSIKNNVIGIDANGSLDLGNALNGITITSDASFNLVGGAGANDRNFVSGNDANGIQISGFSGTGAHQNRILGNLIGLGSSQPLGNTGFGVVAVGLAPANFIGGSFAGEGNIIAFNGEGGVAIVGSAAAANRILSNSIYLNGKLGIDLFSSEGVDPNDLGDLDSGGNNLQNFPVITAVMPGIGQTTIQGILNSAANTSFLLQFFSNAVCDPSGNGEGQTFLGEPTPANVTTDGSGNATFSVTVPSVVVPGQILTATATDIGPSPLASGVRPSASRGIAPSPGSTSEFSACFTVGGLPTPTPTPTPLTPIATLTPTSTTTPTTGPASVNIPALSDRMLVLLAVALAGVAVLLVRRL